MTDAPRDARCSFCADSGVPLAAGPGVYICERCTRLVGKGFGVPIADEGADVEPAKPESPPVPAVSHAPRPPAATPASRTGSRRPERGVTLHLGPLVLSIELRRKHARTSREEPTCIFCARAAPEVRVVAAPRGGICEECTRNACAILGLELK